MAATLYSSGAETGPGMHSNAYSRSMMTDYDYRDGRYPSIPSQSTSNGSVRNSAVLLGTQNMGAWEKEAKEDDEYFSRQRPMNTDPTSSPSQDDSPPLQQKSSPKNQPATTMSSQPEGSSSSKYQEQSRNAVSYALPQGAPRRVMERYSLENNDRPEPSSQVPADISPDEDTVRITTSQTSNRPPQLVLSTAPKHPSLPSAGIGAQSSNTTSTSPAAFMPLSASPTYSPPVSSRQRAYAQQPTYIQNVSPMPVYLPKNPPVEEVCIECAMRDQDMADVDVTSPGVWERESDIHYEDLRRTQAEEEATGIINTDTPPRPRATGGKLTEANVRLWLSVNPREPTSRQQTLNTFVRAQRALLEAESAAHTQAMKEAQHLDNRMRDAYSQLRRSAYDTGSSAAPADDSGGIRIRPPSSSSVPAPHERSHSRDVTLLENGMIVEHVDVRKEEREAKSRQKREERRARKSSKSSAFDATSLISSQSLILPSSPVDNNGAGLSPYSRNSQASSLRPMSVLTSGDRPDIPRAYSQASFSDMHSLGSPSPRRSRFFGNLRASGWLSQDSLAPSGMSGSMVDMHVALHTERQQMVTSPTSLHRNSEYWPKTELQATPSRHSTGTPEKKKKKGLAKIWQLVSRSKDKDRAKETPESTERTEDDYPLAPPPPLSYLVDRRLPGDRHASTSTPSLPSTISPKFGLATSVSPPTAPSSSIPSPTSSRRSGADSDTVSPEPKQPNGNHGLEVRPPESGRLSPKGVYPVLSEPDLRGRASPKPSTPAPPMPSGRMTPVDKSLPPLPPDAIPRPNVNFTDPRPKTFYTLDSQPPPGASLVHDFAPPSAPFRGTGSGSRRQSFSGLTSRPAFLSKTVNTTPSRPLTAHYDEFGSSRRSLGLKDLMAPIRNTVGATTPGKRKSRFGLASLLGRKSPAPEKELNGNGRDSAYIYNSPAVYGDGQEDVMTGYATSSRHSVLSSSNTGVMVTSGGRVSMASRKGLEDLVAQDPEFVAYRYPSQDQRIEMLK